MNFQELELNPHQAETFARGLFCVAHADGAHDREMALVAAFWADVGGSAQALSDLSRRETLSGEELAASLPDTAQRHLFIKTAFLLALADGKISEEERGLIHRYASALGLAAELPGLLGQVKEYLLGHLNHVQNTDAVVDVAKKLEI